MCFHSDTDACDYRKPKLGMILKAATDYQIDLAPTYMEGDRWRDVGAGWAARYATLFIDYGYKQDSANHPDMIAKSLQEVAALIVVKDRESVAR